MSLPELSNVQINEQLSHDHTFGNTLTKDKVPILKSKYYIINLDDSTGPGTHWTLVDNRNPSKCIYFDSYGMPPPENVAAHMRQTGKPNLEYNDVDVQALGSEQCGWWCEYIADELKHGYDFKKVVALAHRQPNPDKYLQHIFEKKQEEEGGPKQFNREEFIKHHYHTGSGLFSWVKNRLHFKPRKHATKRFSDFLQKDGDKQVVHIELGKEPIDRPVEAVLNALSFGALNKKKKELHYNEIYHNYLLVTLRDGRIFKIEKNHVVEAKQYFRHQSKDGYEQLRQTIPIPDLQYKRITLNSLIQNAEANDAQFWNYDPATNNCQNFVHKVITKSELTPEDEEERRQLQPQQGQELIGTLPKVLQGIPVATTNLAGVLDRTLHGDGAGSARKKQKTK